MDSAQLTREDSIRSVAHEACANNLDAAKLYADQGLLPGFDFDGEVDLAVPSGTQPGTTMRIEGKGAPKLNNINTRGTHFVKVDVQIPKSLSAKERELVTQLKKEIG